MALAYLQRRAALKDKVAKALEDGIVSGALKEALEKWADAPKDEDNTKACAKVIKAELPAAIAAASGDAKAALQALDAQEKHMKTAYFHALGNVL